MDIEIKNKYCEAEKYVKPVVSVPIPKDIFIKHLKEGINKIFTRTKMLNKIHHTYVNMLDYYLEKYGINEIVPDEFFFKQIWDRLMEDGQLNGKLYTLATRKKVARSTRQIVNEYFLLNGITLRKILKEVVWQRYERFFKLTKHSQNIITWFEEHGKIVRALPVYIENKDSKNLLNNGGSQIKRVLCVSDRKLLPIPKATKIQQAMLLLDIIGKNGFEFVANEDVKKLEEYCDNRNLKKKQDYLADVATFFANIHEQGFVETNPFGHVSLKKNAYSSVKNEFFSPEAVEKLLDISNINFKDNLQVRDRLFALLGYDLAMRLNEILSLKISDIQKDPEGEMYINLRSEIQKGHKNESAMYFFCDQTRKLLEIYLSRIRKKFNPQTDHLILSDKGTPLSSHQCRKQFQSLCEKFNLKTFYGKRPSPHCLRHTFATLNIEPLGLSLPLSGIMDRLRHTRSEIAERHYIHNNPFLQKLKHNNYRKRIKKQTPFDLLNDIHLSDLEHWLSDKLKVDAPMIDLIRRKHKLAFIKSEIDKASIDTKLYISEEEAVVRLKHLNIPARSLRKYSLENDALEKEKCGTYRYGKGFKYREDFIESLGKNWVPFQNLKVKLKLPTRTLYHVASKEGWRMLKVGRHSFIHREDCV